MSIGELLRLRLNFGLATVLTLDGMVVVAAPVEPVSVSEGGVGVWGVGRFEHHTYLIFLAYPL